MALLDAGRPRAFASTLLLALLSPAALPAQAAVSEPFEYPSAGADLLAQAGGAGFAGPWFASGFNASIHDNYDVAAGSLSFAELVVTGNRVASAATGAIAGLGRNLMAPIPADASATLYFSLLLRPEGTLGQGAFNGFFGAYLDGTGNADLFVGKPGSSAAARYVIENRGGSGQVQSAVAPVTGSTTLLVVRADLQPGPDVFTLYVDPDPCAPEPAAGVVKSDLDLGEVSALVIYSTGAFSSDELRLGESFESAVPCEVREPFDYTPVGSDLMGQDGGSGLAGPWFASGFNASIHDNYDIAMGSLTFEEMVVTGKRVASAATNAIAGLGRNLAVPIAAGATTTVYFSLLLRPEGTLGQGAFNGFFGVYLDGTGDADLFVGKPGSAVAGRYVLENRGGAGQVQSGVAPVVGETVLLVVRAELRPGGDGEADVFTLYVNPDPCQPEPDSGTVKSDLDLGEVSALVIYSTGAFSLDELRLGASFERVVRSGGAVCLPAGAQRPSDCNQDGQLDLSDAVCLFGFLFLGSPVRLPCDTGLASEPGNIALLDANGDAQIDLSDGVRVLSFLFGACALPPCAPPVLGTRCVEITGCPDLCIPTRG